MAIGRLYAVEFHAVAVSAQQDLFYLKPAADKPIEVQWAKIRNVDAATDAGDAKEEDWRVELIYLPATVTAGTGGASATPHPVRSVNDVAASFTARTNDATTVASTTGTAVNLDSDGMNNRIGYDFLPPEANRPVVANAAAIVLRLVTTPVTATLLNGTIHVAELV